MFHSCVYRPPRVRVYVVASVLVLMMVVLVCAQREVDGPTASEPQKSGESKSKRDEDLFRKLFAQQRKDHIEAVRSLLKMDNYEHLYKMIFVLTEKMVNVIESSRNVIEKADFLSDISSFPEDNIVKDALSSILESTAFFGDIVLHLPSITHRILKAQQKWNSTMHWSLNFVNQTRHLLDNSTITMIGLVQQELNITERDPRYFNPYRSTGSRTGMDENTAKTKKKKLPKREKRKKGPQIAKIEL